MCDASRPCAEQCHSYQLLVERVERPPYDFAAEVRTLDRLGLANKSVARIKDIVQNGFP